MRHAPGVSGVGCTYLPRSLTSVSSRR